MEWISIEDRLPDMTGELFTIDVIALNRMGLITVSSLYIGSRQSCGIIGYGRDSCGYNHDVIYWMPLPELPKK